MEQGGKHQEESENPPFQKLNDLIHRGLIKPLLIISDDFPGLKEAIDALFDKTDHQLCFIHMQRNVRKNMGKKDSKEFNDSLKTLRTFKDFDKAINAFEKFCQQYQKKYPHFIQLFLNKKERYFVFLKYPQTLRKHIYTTWRNRAELTAEGSPKTATPAPC